ncbi:MAG: zinc ribbon domain-containing protein [Colwellia sp.]|nr:zinc ribbon domain-containing protein [Colwellia sp.]
MDKSIPRKIKAFKAAVFKVKLSSKKANIIDTQMQLAENAYYKSLEKMAFHVEVISKLDKKGRKEAIGEVKKQVAQIVKPLPLANGTKGSVIEDVAAQISSTVELKIIGQEANLPTRESRAIDNYGLGMEALAMSITTVQEDAAKDLIYTKAWDGMPRPLNWLRSRPNDGAMLLKDDKNRFFIYLNTHSSKSKFAINKTTISNMVDTRSGELTSFSSRTGILLSLELSQWHQSEFIEKAQAKSYKLVKRDDGYFLSISFEFEVDAIMPITTLGVDRGIDALAAYAVTKDREVLTKGIFSGLELKKYQKKHEERHKNHQKMGRIAKQKWRGYGDIIVFIVANEIVETALKHESQVVMEDLSNIANGHHKKRVKFARKSNFSRMLSRQQYQKLQHVLTYKLKCVGLPEPRYVHAAGTSITCNKCGHYDKKNRQTQADFQCMECNHSENADIHASSNISMKLHWLKTEYSKQKKKMKMSFSDWLALT